MKIETDPSPEFLGHLEWQVRTAARHEKRFARPVSARGWRGLRAAAVIVLAVALGAGGVFAAERWQQSREAELRAAQWEVQLGLASARLAAATEDRDAARERFEAGVSSRDELVAAERELQRIQQACARLESEAAEVAETGTEPSDRISALRVGGRDFVRERLELDAAVARADAQSAAELEALAEQRHAAGVATDAEVHEADLAQKSAQAQQQLAARRISLRAAYVDGTITAIQAELDDLRLAAECSVSTRRAALEAARGVQQRVDALAKAGEVTQQDLRRALLRVAEAQAALRLAELELRVLAGKGQR